MNSAVQQLFSVRWLTGQLPSTSFTVHYTVVGYLALTLKLKLLLGFNGNLQTNIQILLCYHHRSTGPVVKYWYTKV